MMNSLVAATVLIGMVIALAYACDSLAYFDSTAFQAAEERASEAQRGRASSMVGLLVTA